jgi:hypothetical protein
MLGRQQWLILLVEKDQQVLQMGKTIAITKEKYLYPYIALDLSELFLPPRKKLTDSNTFTTTFNVVRLCKY